MAWETRQRGGRYYTRSHKVRGRDIREYVGTGERGEQAALKDQLRREAQTAERERARERRERYMQADAALASYCQHVEAHLRAELVTAGYRQHDRGEWRRTRGKTRGR